MASKKKNNNSKSNKKQQPKAEASAPVFDVSSMEFWRDVAKSIIPKDTDEMHIGEVATVLRLQTGLFSENWKDMNRIAQNTGEDISVSWSWKINRSSHPSTVKVSGSFSEKHPMKGESDVPDPDQSELPGEVKDDEKQVAASSDGSDEAEAEGEAPRVHSDDEKEN